MTSGILPAILSAFTELESLHVRVYNWDYFDSNCEQAIYTLITRSSLSSIEIKEARLETNARLLSLLRCLPTSLESASFLNVFARWSYGEDPNCASPEFHQLRLTSLHLISFAPMIFHWVIRAVDFRCLRHLHTEVRRDTIDVVQQLLDSAVCVETYHLSLPSKILCVSLHIFFRQIDIGVCHTAHDENLDLEKMHGLRTLEISVSLDWGEIEEINGQGQHNPLNDAMRTLDTAPHTVEHIILNLNIWDPDELDYFTEYGLFEHFANRPALRDVVVRIVSGNGSADLQRGIRYLEAVFYRLRERGMLTVVAVRPPRLEDD
ncbi:hypothetical protein B0H11DRAFT_2261549 [Mycena galericulata]|nr:hypothetical protein B0H11DRAFT_2261549 [Mycena galericulata]